MMFFEYVIVYERGIYYMHLNKGHDKISERRKKIGTIEQLLKKIEIGFQPPSKIHSSVPMDDKKCIENAYKYKVDLDEKLSR
jgi:hypothetical protein